MHQVPTYTTWKITCRSAEDADALRQWLSSRIDLDRVVTDTVRTAPNGVEQVQTVQHRLGDFFAEIRVLPDSKENLSSSRLVFHRHPGAGRFWKDLMVSILQEIKTEHKDASVVLDSKGEVACDTATTGPDKLLNSMLESAAAGQARLKRLRFLHEQLKERLPPVADHLEGIEAIYLKAPEFLDSKEEVEFITVTAGSIPDQTKKTHDAATALADQELNREFMKYLRVRLFGLLAFVDRPAANEHFPMASGVVIKSEGHYVLLTVAHYLEDLKRWKDEKRLNALFLLVHHESGICNPIPFDLDENPGSFCNDIDVGFVMLSDPIVGEISRYGGVATRRDTLSMSPEAMNKFYLVGHASAYCNVVRETIATTEHCSTNIAWKLSRPEGIAVVTSKVKYDGNGSDIGTLRFALTKGYDDYSGASGGPIFGYAAGSLIRDYCLFAIQSKQIRGATGEQKPTHLIATSAAVAIHVIDDYLRRAANAPA